MAMYKVDLPTYYMVIFNSYASLPEASCFSVRDYSDSESGNSYPTNQNSNPPRKRSTRPLPKYSSSTLPTSTLRSTVIPLKFQSHETTISFPYFAIVLP